MKYYVVVLLCFINYSCEYYSTGYIVNDSLEDITLIVKLDEKIISYYSLKSEKEFIESYDIDSNCKLIYLDSNNNTATYILKSKSKLKTDEGMDKNCTTKFNFLRIIKGIDTFNYNSNKEIANNFVYGNKNGINELIIK